MAKARLIVFRHGKTRYNKDGLITGQRDVPLLPEGEAEAVDAGKVMSGIRFGRAFSSPLSRAFNTAAFALGATGSNDHLRKPDGTWNIETDPDIIEQDVGDFTGLNHKTDAQIVAWERIYDVPPPNGESDKEMVARVTRFFNRKALPHLLAGEDVMVAAHSGVVRAFEIVTGVEPVPVKGIFANPAKHHIPNASPTVYEFEDGKLVRHYQMGPKP